MKSVHSSDEITLVRLASVCPSLSFLKIESLVFSDIVHDDSQPWYLVTDGARFLEKKILAVRIWTKWVKIKTKTSFLPFSQVWFITFPLNCIG